MLNKLIFIISDNFVDLYSSSKEGSEAIDTFFLNDKNHLLEIEKILSFHKKKAISIILYSKKQNLELLLYPDIGALNIVNKVNQKIGNKISGDNISDCIILKKPTIEDDNWCYRFNTIEGSPQIKKLILLLLNQTNKVDGIYFYHFELIKISKYFNRKLNKKLRQSNNIFYLRSKFGFLHKVVFIDDNIVEITTTHNLKSQINIHNKQPQQSDRKTKFYAIGNYHKEALSGSLIKLNNSQDLNVSSLPKVDDSLIEYMRLIKSKPLNIPEINKIRKSQSTRNFTNFFIIIILIICGFLLYKSVNQKSLTLSLLSTIQSQYQSAKQSSTVLDRQLHRRLQVINKDSNLLSIYKYVANDHNLEEILSMAKELDQNLVKINSLMCTNNTNFQMNLTLVLNADNNQNLSLTAKNIIDKIRSRLPNYSISYHRKSDSNIKNNDLLLEVSIKDNKHD